MFDLSQQFATSHFLLSRQPRGIQDLPNTQFLSIVQDKLTTKIMTFHKVAEELQSKLLLGFEINAQGLTVV